MSASARDVALAHYDDRRRLVRAATAAALAMWGQVRPGQLSRSWLDLLPRVSAIVHGAQLAAASSANSYTEAVLGLQGLAPDPLGTVEPSAFAGIASDGRPLDTLLMNPVIAVKTAIRQGARARHAMSTGRSSLEMTVRTQVADAGRVADGVAIAVRPRTGYVRMLVGTSCSRCAILAGRFYRYSAGFERHPQCDCTHIPTAEDVANDLTTDPMEAFRAGRITGLSEADTKALRDGADISQVVNAHRGMYVAGGRKLTREGITRRGIAGARLITGDPTAFTAPRGDTGTQVVSTHRRRTAAGTRMVRVRGAAAARMRPEQIYRESSSRDEAVRLLKLHGFIV